MKCCMTCKNKPTGTGPSKCDTCIGSNYERCSNLFKCSGINEYKANMLQETLEMNGVLTKEDIENILGGY